MAVVGTAYVEIRALGNKLNSDIKKQLESAVSSDVGDKVGKTISESIEKSTIKESAASSKRIGEKVGADVEKNVNKSIDRRRFHLPEFDSAKTKSSLNRAFGGLSRFFQKIDEPLDRFALSMEGMARRVDKASRFVIHPVRTLTDSITGATLKIGAMPAALGAAGAAISSLASSAFSMSAAIAPAFNTLATLPGLLTAVVTPAAATIIAFQGVGDAYKAMVKATDGTEASLKKLREKMKSLSPEAKSFVKTLFANRDAFLAVREAAGKDLFGPLESALKTLIDGGGLDLFKKGLQDAGGEVGRLADHLAKLTADPIFQGHLTNLFESTNVVIQHFADALINIVDLFVTLGDAASPVTEEFAHWIEVITSNWASDAVTNFDTLRAKIQEGAEVVKQLSRIFGNIWGTISNLGDAAKVSGQSLLDSFEKATAKLRELTGGSENQDKLAKFFEDAATNARALGDIVVAIAKALLGMGDNTALADMSDSIITAVENLGVIGETALDAFGPELATVIEKATTVIREFMEAGGTEGMEHVLPVISKLLDLLTAIVKIPGLATFVSYLFAFGSAFSILAKIKVPQPLVTIFKEVFAKYLPKILPWITRFAPKLLAFAGPIGVAVAAIFTLVQGFKWLYENVAGFRDFIDGIVASVKDFGERLAALAQAVLPSLKAAFGGVITVVSNVFNVLKTVVTAIWDSIVAFFSGDADKIPGILKGAFGDIIGYVQNIFGGLKTIVVNIWNALVIATGGKIRGFVDAIRRAFQPVVNVVTGVFGLIKTVITTVWNAIVALFSGRANEIPKILGAGFAKARDYIVQIFVNLKIILAALWHGIVTVVTGAIKGIWVVIVAIGKAIWASIVHTWNGIKNVIVWTVKGIWTVIVAIFNGIKTFIGNIFKSMRWIISTIMLAVARVIGSRIRAIRDVFVGIFTAVRKFVSNVFAAIRDRILTVVKAVVNFVAARFRAMRDTISAVFASVRNVIAAAWNWIKIHVFKPMRAGIDAVRAAFSNARTLIAAIWTNLRERLRAGYVWIRDRVYNALKTGIDAVRERFSTIRTRIAAIWTDLRDKLHAGYVWIRDNVFGKFKTGLNSLKTAFSNVRKGIAEAWQKLRGAAARPINFVLGKVYNDGIAHWWNTIAKKVGLTSLKLPAADLIQYAKGGFNEKHVAQIARGGAMRLWAEPETGGEAYIPLGMNKRRRSKRILEEVARRFGMSVTPFKNGGFWDNVGSVVSGVGRGVKGFGNKLWNYGKMAIEVIKDPVKAIKRAVSQILTQKGGGGFSGDLIKMAGALPQKFASGLATKVKSLFDAGKGKQLGDGGTGGGTGGGGLRGNLSAMAAVARQLMPGAVVTSGYRPGAVTVTGFPSYHGKGRAIDLAGVNLGKLWDKLYAAYGKSSAELYYSGRWFSRFGKKGAPRNDHWDHVHWAMANGGLLDWVGKFVQRGIPQLAEGGTVRATSGGVLARIAERGQDERVTPLRRDGLSEGEARIIEALENMPRGGDTVVKVYAAPGMDEIQVANAAARRIGWELRKGS